MHDEQEQETLQQLLADYGKAYHRKKASDQCPRIVGQIDAAKYGRLIQAILNDLQKVFYKHRMDVHRIPDNKMFKADLFLLSTLCERGVTYQQEDLQAILSLVIPFFQTFFPMQYLSRDARLPFLQLLSSFIPALQQQELLNACRSECEILYTYAYLWGNFKPLHEAYHLRQQFEEVLFADNAPGLIFQLHRYAAEDDPDSDEQVRDLRATLLQEQGKEFYFASDHPAFDLLRQTSPHIKKRMILAALQEGLLLGALPERSHNQTKAFVTDERTVEALLTDELSWTDAEIQSLPSFLGQVGDLHNPDINIIALLQYALSLLKASGKSFHNQKELLALDEKLAKISLGYSHGELHKLRQSLAEILSAGGLRGLTALLHAYQENGQQSGEEQVQALLDAYRREIGDFTPPVDYPLLQLMERTLSASLKVHVISALMQSRSLAVRDMNLVTALSAAPLACSKEDVCTLLQSCVMFYSNENLRTTYYGSSPLSYQERELFLQWGACIVAALRAIAPCLKQPDIHDYVQEELHTLYTWSHEADYTNYFVDGSRETYELRLLIADLCYAGNPPGLAPLLSDDAEKTALSEEDHARAVLTAYHQELSGSNSQYPWHASELINQQASEHLKAHLVKEALQDAYTSTLGVPYYSAHPLRYDHNVLLIQVIFTYDLPYSNEDIYGILVGIANLLRQEEQYYRLFHYHVQALSLFHLFKTFLPLLKPAELERLCQNELVLLYKYLAHFEWHQLQQEENQLRLLVRGLLFPQSAGPLRDFLQDNTSYFTSDDEIRALLVAYHEELGAGAPYERDEELIRLLQQRLSVQSIVRLLHLSEEEIDSIQPGPLPAPRSNAYQVSQDLLLIKVFFNKDLPFSPEDIHVLLHGLQGIYSAAHVLEPYVRELEQRLRQPDVLAQCRADIEWLLDQTKNAGSDADVRRFHLLLRDLLSERQQQFSYPLLPDRWGTSILNELSDLNPEQRDPLLAILNLCAEAKATAPTDTWQEQAHPLVEVVGIEQLTPILRRWIDLFTTQKDGRMDSGNSDILRGLIWLCRSNSNRGLAATLADAAIEGYRKLSKEGPRCPKVGDAGVFTLATMAGKDAISQLERVRRNVKQPSFQEKIGKTLDTVAKREQMSREDMEELMLPTFDLQDGQLQSAIGEWTVQIRAEGRKVEPRWFDDNGQSHATLPAKFKRKYKEEIEASKRLAGDIEHLLSAQRVRLERMYLNERHWPLEDWCERYVEHPLLSVLARRLIWQISSGERSWRVIWQQGQLVNVLGQPCELPAQSEVTLWHPLMSDPQEAQRWQLWLEEQQITQPFKQAHREIYPITDAELATRYYSHRFADHIIRQHQFNALARARDWHFSLHSDFSGAIQDDPAYIEIPSVGLRAEFTLSDPVHQGITRYLLTKQVRFQRIIGTFYSGQFVALEEIPAIIFSEVMRDVDLFVSITSGGTDFYGHDETGSVAEYWQRYNQEALPLHIGERRQLLERLLPRLAISERCSLEERFLIVRGDLHTYRIHLLSGNILMEPREQYLCIVFDAQMREKEEERFFLPFEGDPLLSLILSKAFLLAEDSKIEDPLILNQIRR